MGCMRVACLVLGALARDAREEKEMVANRTMLVAQGVMLFVSILTYAPHYWHSHFLCVSKSGGTTGRTWKHMSRVQ